MRDSFNNDARLILNLLNRRRTESSVFLDNARDFLKSAWRWERDSHGHLPPPKTEPMPVSYRPPPPATAEMPDPWEHWQKLYGRES